MTSSVKTCPRCGAPVLRQPVARYTYCRPACADAARAEVYRATHPLTGRRQAGIEEAAARRDWTLRVLARMAPLHLGHAALAEVCGVSASRIGEIARRAAREKSSTVV